MINFIVVESNIIERAYFGKVCVGCWKKLIGICVIRVG